MNIDKKKIIDEIERLLNSFSKHHGEVLSIDQNTYNLLGDLKLFINSLPAEQPSEDFKEEFNNFCVHGNIRNPNFEGPFGYDDIRKTATHFAQWQKEQLMKSAVDATVSGGGCHISLVPEKDISQICKGDRVKIITVKEDELPVGNKDTGVRFPSFEESQGETVYDSYNIVLNG